MVEDTPREGFSQLEELRILQPDLHQVGIGSSLCSSLQVIPKLRTLTLYAWTLTPVGVYAVCAKLLEPSSRLEDLLLLD